MLWWISFVDPSESDPSKCNHVGTVLTESDDQEKALHSCTPLLVGYEGKRLHVKMIPIQEGSVTHSTVLLKNFPMDKLISKKELDRMGFATVREYENRTDEPSGQVRGGRFDFIDN